MSCLDKYLASKRLETTTEKVRDLGTNSKNRVRVDAVDNEVRGEGEPWRRLKHSIGDRMKTMPGKAQWSGVHKMPNALTFCEPCVIVIMPLLLMFVTARIEIPGVTSPAGPRYPAALQSLGGFDSFDQLQ
ncbi:hypothetical protein EVAR_5569_1 [Eumeta japonica]|uniref:Uncharacterized protein n=1 Tax=Eumeta variegata TaxID=151549 RepID=A0A4C1U1H3_EUMVA|nr:hypothetical protein EVAR_5569_1 [Eumeta japonica]